jgi:FMN phosphatase YigB (HAD superfamily)
VRALLFDLGNVLVRFDHDITLDRLARATGIPAETLRPRIFSGLEDELGLGRLTEDEFFRAAEKSAGLPRLPDDVWIPAWRDIFTPIPESLALLPRLRSNVATALVSNTNALHWDGVRRIADVERWMDAFALSFEVGAAKPDRRIFEKALERLGKLAAIDGTPSFADDRADFVKAAMEIGLDAFIVDSPETLERELKKRDLLGERDFGGEKDHFFEKGIEDFHSGKFFEAHEEWEELWKKSTGRDKVFLQGLIQLAAGLVHEGRGNPAPARRLFDLALEKLETFPRVFGGLRVREICNELRRPGSLRGPITL